VLKVNNIFKSIQGEGLHIGRPASFIRLAGCNLKCTWCDTKYAFEDGKEMTIEQILEEVAGSQLVVITGGEPLIQDISELVKALASYAHEVHVETNGTIPPYHDYRYTAHFVVSPKLPSSGMWIHLNKDALKKFRATKKAEFKFVIADYKDFMAMYNIVGELKLLPCVLQPINNSKSVAKKIIKWVYKHHALSARVLPQYHRYLWGGERGK